MASPSLPLDVLKGFQQAHAAGGDKALAAAIEAYAAQTGMSTAAVVAAIRASSYGATAAVKGFADSVAAMVRAAVSSGALVPSEAVPLAAGGGGGGLLAWFAGLGLGAKVGLVAGVVVLVVGGAWVAGTMSGDSPLQPVDRTAVPYTDPFQGGSEGSVFIGIGAYENGNLAIISVRTKEAVAAGIPWCDFHLGGLDCETKAATRALTAEYDNAADATRELCALLSGPPFEPALSDGYRAPYGSGSVVVDDWSALDLDVCNSVTGG